MNFERSDRGFKRMEPIQANLIDAYGPVADRGRVRVYESSNAQGPHLWLAVSEPTDRNYPIGPKNPAHEAHADLTLEAAEMLRDQMTWLIENHYQLGPVPGSVNKETE